MASPDLKMSGGGTDRHLAMVTDHHAIPRHSRIDARKRHTNGTPAKTAFE
jgi:hypothetical protein